MSRALAGLAAGAAGIVAWLGLRNRNAAPAEIAPPAEQPTPIVMPPVATIPPPPSFPPNPRLTPQDVLALRPYADPEGWLPPADLLAFVERESSFRPNAIRYEAHLGESSYGLMQVLLSTARDMGHEGAPEELFDPLTNLTIGVRYLRWIHAYLTRRFGREPTQAEWVGAYNAGIGNVADRGFLPYGYIGRWQTSRDRYQSFNGWAA